MTHGKTKKQATCGTIIIKGEPGHWNAYETGQEEENLIERDWDMRTRLVGYLASHYPDYDIVYDSE